MIMTNYFMDKSTTKKLTQHKPVGPSVYHNLHWELWLTQSLVQLDPHFFPGG